MTVPRQLARIPLGASIDESAASPLVQPGTLEASRNLWVRTRGQARPRPRWTDWDPPSAVDSTASFARRGVQEYSGRTVDYYSAVEDDVATQLAFYARVAERVDLPVVGINELAAGSYILSPYESVTYEGAVYSCCAVYEATGLNATT